MTQAGPPLCQEYRPYNEKERGFTICYSELVDGTCNKVHASTREVADRFVNWGYRRGLVGVLAVLYSGVTIEELQDHIKGILVK